MGRRHLLQTFRSFAVFHQPRNPAEQEADDQQDDEQDQPVLIQTQK